MATDRGLTLIELVLVLAVIAILVTASVPTLGDMIDRHRLRGAAEDLYGVLLLARMEAIRRNAPVSVTFRSDPGTGDWCHALSDRGPCDCQASGDCTLGGAPPRRTSSRDYAGIRLTTNFSPQATATFQPARGTANAGTTRLSNGAGDVDLVVSSLGRVRVCSSQMRDYPPC